MNITHEHPEYIKMRNSLGSAKNNGAYYYSKEIVDNIIPNVKTTREWNTVGQDLDGMHDGMIVFLHSNATPWIYSWLKKYKDLVLVCSCDYVRRSVQFSGHTVFLPMSVDTEYVKKFKVKEKTRDVCFVGNPWVLDNAHERWEKMHPYVDILSSRPRDELLRELAKYEKAYAIDRCAIEAKILGCELLPIKTRYSVDNIGTVLDNRDAAKILQEELNKIDGGKNGSI